MEQLPALARPDWVPDAVVQYLAHTVTGRSIRDLARCAGCHASTILRQIRRVEVWRDDPLVDAALTELETIHFKPAGHAGETPTRAGLRTGNITEMTSLHSQPDTSLQTATLEHHARLVLRRLCESDAVLAVAEDMDKAVVVRDDGTGAGTRTAIVENTVAQAMALNKWIACAKPGRVSRYRITATGRSALSRFLAKEESRASAAVGHGFAEAQMAFEGAALAAGNPAEVVSSPRSRFASAESPLAALARRKDRDGRPFLDDELVRAGERLREDFEMAQMGPRVAQNWDRFLTVGSGASPDSGAGDGPSRARMRMAGAIDDLGPGLSDVALRCCCYLEGLESAEKRMGWSARSGKIVLRIALQRLRLHYVSLSEADRRIG